ncbi:hypothetical protein [Streptomyces sp. NPDC001401]|uniref:hypothetical protein n=1 Tax=Streptomyces sp. NPDC001401 TaxID=3364570 RepID=UPI00367A889E
MTHPPALSSGVHLRLVRPQWQGAGTSSIKAFASEFPFDVAPGARTRAITQ